MCVDYLPANVEVPKPNYKWDGVAIMLLGCLLIWLTGKVHIRQIVFTPAVTSPGQ